MYLLKVVLLLLLIMNKVYFIYYSSVLNSSIFYSFHCLSLNVFTWAVLSDMNLSQIVCEFFLNISAIMTVLGICII